MAAAVSRELRVSTKGRGLYAVTDLIRNELEGLLPVTGLLNIFIQHTSASLLVQENADPTAKMDLEEFFERLAPEGESWHRHLTEGPDDTVSHLRASVLPTSLTIPIANGRLGLGTWQGIYVFEHRQARHERRLLLTVLS